MCDKVTTINELKNNIDVFMRQRGWNNSLPVNTVISITLEATELLEIFQWDKKVFSKEDINNDKGKMNDIRKEMADIIIYTLSLSEKLGIDISDAVEDKLIYNAKKYPVKYFNTNEQNLNYYKKIKKLYRSKKVRVK